MLVAAITSLAVWWPSSAHAQPAVDTLAGPDATTSLLERDATEKDGAFDLDVQRGFDAWKAGLKARTGLDFGLDYNLLGYVANTSPGADSAASGAFRLFGSWDLIRRGGPNTGGLVFKLEHRHGLGDVPVTDFSAEHGYVGLVSSVFNDQDARLTNLHWSQDFADGRGVAAVGWLDVSDFVDVFALASSWTGFSNLAFQTGSGTIAGLPDGALGAMAAGFLSKSVYVTASIVDANGDPTDPFDGFDTLPDQGETFKTFELGWTSGAEALFIDNAHLTFWQIDGRPAAGSRESHGMAFSYTRAVDDAWLPFVRGGWAEGGGSLYEASASVGFGYTRNPGRSLTALGLNWSRPNEETFGTRLDDQLTLEGFSRWQLTEGLEITPSVQIIRDPALDPDESTIALVGLRLRAAF
jgi:porin